jgi:signal transduction histidine kinase
LAIEKLKTKLAADLHDNIGSGLTVISILSELAKKEIETTSTPNVQGKLKNISDAARQLVDNMSDIVWVVNPKRDSLHDLLVRLKDSYSDILSSYGISFKIIDLDNIINLTLPMEYRQNLYLIFKEGINNAVKHSKCKRIALESNVRDNVIELILVDDGIGLDIENLDYGNGIRNMEARSKNIGGSLKWNSTPERGTTIRFIGQIKNPNLFNKIFYTN